MKDQILKIKEDAKNEINNANSLQSLNDVRVKFLGKKGELTADESILRQGLQKFVRQKEAYECQI